VRFWIFVAVALAITITVLLTHCTIPLGPYSAG
jgi:hypothetical protein